MPGFTLIELLVAVLILGILAGVGIPAYMRYAETARKNTTETNLKLIKQAVNLFKTEVGSLPKKLEELVERPSGPAGKKWKEPYFEDGKLPKDAWGYEFVYRLTPQGKQPFELYSNGGSNGPEEPDEKRISVWDL